MGYRSLDASLGKLWGQAGSREQSSAFSEVLLLWVGKWPYYTSLSAYNGLRPTMCGEALPRV